MRIGRRVRLDREIGNEDLGVPNEEARPDVGEGGEHRERRDESLLHDATRVDLLIGDLVAALNVGKLLIQFEHLIDERINELPTRRLERWLLGELFEDAGNERVEVLRVAELDHLINRVGKKRDLQIRMRELLAWHHCLPSSLSCSLLPRWRTAKTINCT